MAKMAQPSPASLEIHRLAEADRRRLGHPHLGDEHLLLAVLVHRSNAGAAMLNARGLDLATARTEIERLVQASGPLVRDDADVPRALGVDVTRMRGRLDSRFGTLVVDEAARQVRRRPWWRGRAHRSPLCGPPHLIKRAQFIACTTAGTRGEAEVLPEHLLYGVLRVAREPLGHGLGRRGRREAARLGLRVGAPHPVGLLFAAHRLDPERFGQEVLATLTTN